MEALDRRGWDLARRPTGGKAILHGDELTYSLCLPLDHPLARGDVIESYRRLSVGLLRALESLGLAAEARHLGASPRYADLGPVCFEMPSHYEICVGGRKLIGSAQLRRKGGLLQHGALPLSGDLGRVCDVLSFASDEARMAQKASVRERAATLSQAVGAEVAWAKVASAMEAGFAGAFDLEMVSGSLSAAETGRAMALADERFGNPAWTLRR